MRLDSQMRRGPGWRHWKLVLWGLAVSMPFHLVILAIFAQWYLPGGGGGDGTGDIEPASIEITMVEQPPLTAPLPPAMVEVPKPQVTPAGVPSPVPLSAAIPAPESSGNLAPGKISSGDLLVGAGGGRGIGNGDGSGGDGDALGGGAAGTSFFGVGSRGTRFAYIVDKSGSMESSRRWWTAVKEMKRSITALPDFAHVHILLYDDGYTAPPFQDGWVRASKTNLGRIERWLDQISPSGGTIPLGGFTEVFSLDVPPDVIFFMTDGEIPADTAVQVGLLNSRGRKVVVHCVAFGDPASQQQLKQIAAESGGQYRFVPMEGP